MHVSRTKKQITENIKDYSNYKILCTLTKPKSHNSKILIEDNKNSWFIYVISYNKKSGDIKNNEIIIKSDYDGWIKFLQNLGWIIDKK